MAQERRRSKGDPPKPVPPRGGRARDPQAEPPPRKPRMKDSGEPAPSVFDVERVNKLVDLMKLHDLSEVELREGRQKIRICRGPREAPRMPPPPPPPPAGGHGAATAAASGPASAGAAEGANIVTFKSPMVGTFYSKPNPKAEAYVRVGSKVDANTIICIIEAMKVFNEIQAEVRGEVVAVLVQDGEAVDFEKPLFKIDTSK